MFLVYLSVRYLLLCSTLIQFKLSIYFPPSSLVNVTINFYNDFNFGLILVAVTIRSVKDQYIGRYSDLYYLVSLIKVIKIMNTILLVLSYMFPYWCLDGPIKTGPYWPV